MNKELLKKKKGKKFAEEKKMLFFESSAMDYESIETIFKGVCQEYLNLVKEKEKKINSMKEEERKKIEEERNREKGVPLNENNVGDKKDGCIC